MSIVNEKWEMLILDGLVEVIDIVCLSAGDIDRDGNNEIVAGGNGVLNWYRPETLEKGFIADGHFHVGMALEDIDGDGLLEVFVGKEAVQNSEKWMLVWYKHGKDLNGPWESHVIDPLFEGGPHDIIFADIDGDGRNELLTIACYTKTPGIYIFKPGKDITKPWQKYAVSEGIFTEGLSAADVNGDGKIEIVSGPDIYFAPADGPFSGLWNRHVYAPGFREMCRTAMLDITGNGRPDIIITDSEYMDGTLSWFENRILEDPINPWVEHVIDQGLIYSHSLTAWFDEKDNQIHVFVGEMPQGGWEAPRNYDARLVEYTSSNRGFSWNTDVISKGEGTHQAMAYDIDQDGVREILGESAGIYWHNPKVQIWKKKEKLTLDKRFKHSFIDRSKPDTAIDVIFADVEGNGLKDIICGPWWYKNPAWERRTIPGVYQVISAYDIDNDGRNEFIAIKRNPKADPNDFYAGLTSELCWVKPVDSACEKWVEYPIGKGDGDWPHGCLVAPLLPGGRLALVTGYHNSKDFPPQIFEIPGDPKTYPWPKKVLADIQYGEEMLACDINGDGILDIAAGCYWIQNMGDGCFVPHKIADDFAAARIAIMDVNGNGRPDIVMGEEVLDYSTKVVPYSRVVWFENPEEPAKGPWKMHVIDTVRCAHSVGIGDLDGDGEPEIVIGEHDPFWPYRSRCKVIVYKKADSQGKTWVSHTIDDRFEHHDGTKVFEIAPGRMGIVSHGWRDSLYLSLWEAY